MWVWLALMAAFLTSFLPVINKRLLRDTDVTVVAWGYNALSLPLLAIAAVALVPLGQVNERFYLGVAASSLLNVAATLLSTQALKWAEASFVTPFLTFNPAFTLLIAWPTLREAPNVPGVSGVLLILIGSYLLGVREAKTGIWSPFKAVFSQRAVLLAILASFFWGLTPITEKIAIQSSDPVNPPLVAFATTFGMSLLLFPLMLKQVRQPFLQMKAHWQGFLLGAFIAGVAPIAGFTAIALGFVGYVTAIFKLSPLFTVLWAHLLLGERGLGERLAGSAAMVIGAIVLAL
jgi:uncharacterized membrane protein